MKKYRLRIPLFALCFVFGLFLVWFLNVCFKSYETYQIDNINLTSETEKTIEKSQKKGITIDFKEFISTKDGLAADFEITNNSAEIEIFSAYNETDGIEPTYTLPEIKINGEYNHMSQCGMGLMNYVLKPGETKIFRLNEWRLSQFWKENKSIQVGFGFTKISTNDFKLYWSENLPITNSIATQLLKKQKQNN